MTPTDQRLVSPDVAANVTEDPPDAAEIAVTGLPDRTLWIMAAACGTAAANIFYNQPLLGKFADTFQCTEARAGLVATAAQVGYGTGIFFFCPLGDLIERRRLVLALMGLCALLLTGAALCGSIWMLILFQLLIGITAMSAQVLIPLAIDLSPPQKRGHTVGILMAGLLVGILLARTAAGFIGDALGWRSVFGIAAMLCVVMGVILWASLPHRAPTLRLSYPRLMHSMIELLSTQPQLWISSVVSGLSFAGFTAFWTTLVFLMKANFHRGASEAGLFGVIGVAGALAAPMAGKVADRWGTQVAITVALVASIAAFVLMGEWVTIPVLVVGVLLMDLGVQSIQVAEQSTRDGAAARIAKSDQHPLYGGPIPRRRYGLCPWRSGMDPRGVDRRLHPVRTADADRHRCARHRRLDDAPHTQSSRGG